MQYNQNDLDAIANARAKGGKVWENEEFLSDLKSRLKVYCLSLTEDTCCYCKTTLTGEFKMVIDIQHILPKNRYSEFMFEIFNLSVSCKRCNMNIKRDSVKFVVDPEAVRVNPLDTNQYLIAHPNLDDYYQHITYEVIIVNNKRSIKYLPHTVKGHFTYDFFKLEKKEIDTWNAAQGIIVTETELSEKIPASIAEEANNLLRQL